MLREPPGGRAAIEKLRQDNAALKEELRLENKFSVQPTLANASALIQNLKEQSDVYTKKARVGAALACSTALECAAVPAHEPPALAGAARPAPQLSTRRPADWR